MTVRMMDSGEHALLALLDLSSAFDTVDHDILLTRLSRSFGVRGDALSWETWKNSETRETWETKYITGSRMTVRKYATVR